MKINCGKTAIDELVKEEREAERSNKVPRDAKFPNGTEYDRLLLTDSFGALKEAEYH